MTLEMIFKWENYWIVVKRFNSGHRAAYVGVPKRHVLYGREEDDPSVHSFVTRMGRVNYADDRIGGWEGYPTEGPVWWFGVDNMDQDIPEETMDGARIAAMQLAKQLDDHQDTVNRRTRPREEIYR